MESNITEKTKCSQYRNIEEYSKEKDLFLIKKGKLFEQYVASFISKELGKKIYKTGMKFSLSKEIDRLLNCVKNKDESDKEKMKTKIDEYRNSCLQEIQSLSSSSDGGTPKNDEKKKLM